MLLPVIDLVLASAHNLLNYLFLLKNVVNELLLVPPSVPYVGNIIGLRWHGSFFRNV